MKNSSNALNRNGMLDCAKGIGIILVIAGHLFGSVELLHTAKCTVFSFHIPLFFIISGVLYNREKYTDFRVFIKKKAQTMFCPYVFFGVLSAAVTVVLNIVFNRSLDAAALKKYVMWFIKLFTAQNADDIAVNLALWFIPCLLVTETLFFFLTKVKSTPLFWIITAGLTAAGYLLTFPSVSHVTAYLPWNLPVALYATGFFALGNLFRPVLLEKSSEKQSAAYSAGIAAASAGCIAAVALIGGGIDMLSMGSRTLGNGVSYYVTGLLGTAGVTGAATLLKKSRVLQYFGRNSLYFMMLHLLVSGVMKKLMRFLNAAVPSVGELDTSKLPQAALFFAADILICILLIAVYKKIRDRILEKKETK